ncbi:MAG: alanine racemase [Candidatus Limnocylindrales bacterium]
MPRLAWLEIDTDALAANLHAFRVLVPASVRVAAVVKADGYGHGIEVAGRTFLAAGADVLCVASLDEAMRLRSAGVQAPILVLFTVPPESAAEAASAGIELVAAEEGALRDTLAAWAAARRPAGIAPLRLHVEVETGLGRAGLRPAGVARAVATILDTPGTEVAGLWTHLASSHDPALSAAQDERFRAAEAAIGGAGLPLPPRHRAATGALLADSAPFDEMIRPGLALYGEVPASFPVAPAREVIAAALRPAMTLKARPLRVERLATGEQVGYSGLWTAPRPSVVATLPVGYGDGWSRAYGGAEVLVRGRRVPLVGSIAMDAFAVDVSDVPGVTTEDEFVLLGRQGQAAVTATGLAHLRTTISWEVLASMAFRLPRVYHAGTVLSGTRTLAGESLTR